MNETHGQQRSDLKPVFTPASPERLAFCRLSNTPSCSVQHDYDLSVLTSNSHDPTPFNHPRRSLHYPYASEQPSQAAVRVLSTATFPVDTLETPTFGPEIQSCPASLRISITTLTRHYFSTQNTSNGRIHTQLVRQQPYSARTTRARGGPASILLLCVYFLQKVPVSAD